MRQFFFPLIVVILSISPINSQTVPSIKWEKPFGGARNDDAQMAIENLSGGITAIGNTKSKSYRGNDIYMLILDQQGNTVVNERNHGGRKDDGANAIVQTYDGGYVIVGYTESDWPESIGKRDAWLIKTDEKGLFIWDQILGSEADDELFDVFQTNNGELIAVGKKNDRLYIVKVGEKGKLLWEQSFGAEAAEAQSLVVLASGEIIVTGFYKKKEIAEPFILKITTDGKKVMWQKKQSDWAAKLEEKVKLKSIRYIKPFDIILTQNNELAITGTAKVDGKREDMFFMKSDLYGNLLQFELYGGQREDGSHALIQTFDGNYLMAGYNSSDAGRGERRSKTWANLIRPDGQRMWDKETGLFGGIQNDEANSILQMNNGDILIAGYSVQLVERDAYFIYLNHTTLPPPISSASLEVNPLSINFHDENNNGMLDPDERGYFSFNLTNNGTTPLNGIWASLDTIVYVEGVVVLPKIIIGNLPALSSKKVTIPVFADENLKSGKSIFEVTIKGLDTAPLQILTLQIESRKETKPQLEIIDHRFIKEGKLKRDAPITLEIDLKNIGDASAKDVRYNFTLPDEVEPLNKRIDQIGDMAPNTQKTMVFRFKPSSLFQKDTIEIEAKFWEKTRRFGTVGGYKMAIPSFEEILKSKEVPELPGNDRGPHVYWGKWLDGINIQWYAPNPRFEGYDVSLENQAVFDAVFDITSDVPLSNDNCKLLIDGQPNSGYLLSANLFKGKGPTFYGFKASFRLTEIGFDVQLQITHSGETHLSEKIRFHRSQKKTNLHVYAFGVPHDDLNYTAKDARDFAAKFKKQGGEGKMYEKTLIYQYTTVDSTSTQAIRDAMDDILNAYDFDETIKKDDTIILFLSSHGLLSDKDESFRIAASDFEDRRKDARSLDFQADMLTALAEIPAKKMVFLDACHSGSAISDFDEMAAAKSKATEGPDSRELTNAITDLASSNPDYSIMSSCGKGQLSYEDSNGQNGAFTQAILDALNNLEVEGVHGDKIKGDENGDGIIYLDELFYFAKERVPMLLKDKKTKQEPYMSEANGKREMPVYVLGD